MGVLGLLIFLSLCSCGIEDYPYIYAIPQANVQPQVLAESATVYVPSDNSSNTYFTNFTVYYRIYVSDMITDDPINNINAINNTLYSHYSRVRPYIDNDSIGSSSVGSLFSSMNYYSIALENANIETNILSSAILGRTITFDFIQIAGRLPSMVIGSNTYPLIRSTGGGNFTIRPNNLYFLNDPELYNTDNLADPNVNTDVTEKANMVAGPRYTYVSLYIVATGLDTQTYSQIFSTPTFVGILRLPDPA
ncbi:hypothetical protein TREAZ_0504 [Leadbettera azotonutricia ZAS-9]|uniref:DUF4270 family protein n=2 Tax=Leadbettera azotonutricia TaxID=150829 RepID=F5YC68_LEAAZ|nr:hypothetical protein TREAZ_0504 [Leadbettera azotonutricia ZAS-9]